MYISLADSRARGFAKWLATNRPGNDDDDGSGGATPIGVTEPPDEDSPAIEEPPHQPWAVPGVGTSL
jgi:hypothetical protein